MTHNDVLRRLRYALELNNPTLLGIFRLAGRILGQSDILALLRKEDEEGYRALSDSLLTAFLDGLILHNRGPQRTQPGVARSAGTLLTNNDILKKIRIALELDEAEMLAVFKLAGFPLSRSELTALFRTKGQANYKQCGDQLLRNFLKGLTLRFRAENLSRK